MLCAQAPEPGSVVKVEYTGWLEASGSEFDTSRHPETPSQSCNHSRDHAAANAVTSTELAPIALAGFFLLTTSFLRSKRFCSEMVLPARARGAFAAKQLRRTAVAAGAAVRLHLHSASAR